MLTVVGVISSWGAWLGMFLMSTMFGGMGAALFLMSATLCADAGGLTVKRPGSLKTVKWTQITRVAEGGGNLVIHTDKGRITAPSFEFWSGPDKVAFTGLFIEMLDKRGIPFRAGSLRASMQVGDR